MKKLFTGLLVLAITYGYSQDNYKDSMSSYQASYVQNHEVVTGTDKELFRFFPVDEKYRITALFEKKNDSKWFTMETSGTIRKIFRIYGVLRLVINDTSVKLNVYQSQNLMNSEEYKDQLFLPFTDLTSGEETYDAGRYIDLIIGDIVDNKVVIDFNKAYNPYCAYVSGKYNCPIPPRENELPVAILAGEKIFDKPH
jgi:uncharacterized protein (DUF1684 family)